MPVYEGSDDGDTQSEPAVTGGAVDRSPEFFPNVWVGCGYTIAFHPPGYGSVPVLVFDEKGHALFPMHSACAITVQRVCASDTNNMTLQSYCNILRKICTLFLAEGGINWSYKHLGAMQYWAHDDWDYKNGYLEFVTDPLCSTDTNAFVISSLETVKALGTRVLPHKERSQTRGSIETLPKEIMDQIVNCFPMDAI